MVLLLVLSLPSLYTFDLEQSHFLSPVKFRVLLFYLSPLKTEWQLKIITHNSLVY